jgi:beta-xylosidase
MTPAFLPVRLRVCAGVFAGCLLSFAVDVSAANSAPWMPDLGDGHYRNPVLFADYSDPDAVRVGDDYYLVASSFCHVPGLPILHSKDLVNWTLIGHALNRIVPEEHFSKPRHGEGVWAPAIRHHGGKFWIYYPDPDFGLYVVTATEPRGPWSAPVLVKAGKGLIDPCPFWDDDGKMYLIHGWAKSRAGIGNLLTLVELSADGTRYGDEPKVVIDANKMPGWRTLEGPKLYKRNGYYYVFAPAGGVKQGWQAVFRSKAIFGPYEERITLDQGKTPINGPHQGAWVDTPGGQDWFLHFQDREAYGRIVHLQPMVWKNDWPVMGEDADNDGKGEPVLLHQKPDLPAQTPAAPETSDEFDGARFNLAWQWQANPQENWALLGAAAGKLRLACVPTPENLHRAANLLMQKLPAPRFAADTEVTLNAAQNGEQAGLIVFGDSYAWIGVRNSKAGLQLCHVVRNKAVADAAQSEKVLAELKPGARVRLAVRVREEAVCQFSYAIDQGDFVRVEIPFTAEPARWVGAKVGLFAAGPDTELADQKQRGVADFSWFRISAEPTAQASSAAAELDATTPAALAAQP